MTWRDLLACEARLSRFHITPTTARVELPRFREPAQAPAAVNRRPGNPTYAVIRPAILRKWLLAGVIGWHSRRMSDSHPTILYPFRKRDPLTGKWYRARWKASLEEIESHNGEWIVDGEPEECRSFYKAGPDAEHMQSPRSPTLPPPAADEIERFLARVFLRRYATYCARRKRYAQAQGAAALWRELSLR